MTFNPRHKPSEKTMRFLIKANKIGVFIHQVYDKVLMVLIIVTAIVSGPSGESVADGLFKLLTAMLFFYLNRKLLDWRESHGEDLQEYLDKHYTKKNPDQ